MLKTFIRTTACLAVSAAAFIVITKMDANAGKRRAPVPETAEPKDAPPKDTASKPPAPRPPAPKLTTASLQLPATTAPSTAAIPARTSSDAAPTVPDWKGKRLSVARREARKLGFNLTAVDENGEAVPADAAWAGYRVRRQLTKAGTPVEPGADVEVRVREIVDAVGGY